jgi:hypothetical protein
LSTASPSPSPSPDTTDEPKNDPTDDPSPSASPKATPSPKIEPAVLPTPPPNIDPKEITYVDPENPPTVDPKKFPDPPTPTTPVVILEQPKFGELKENPNGTFTYIPNEDAPETPTLDQATFQYTALSGATVVVRKQFILVEKGDVPSIIQTGYGPVSNNYGFALLLLLPIALVVALGRKGAKNV